MPRAKIEEPLNTKELFIDENDVMVPESKLKSLTTSETLKPFLEHSKLKEVIKNIYGAKNRKKALQKRMQND